MKKKTDCGFRFKGIVKQSCVASDGIHPDIILKMITIYARLLKKSV